jgi:gamma-glutamyltranspeptidase/glutathione hydrolase
MMLHLPQTASDSLPAAGNIMMYDGRETAPSAATPERFQWGGFDLPFLLSVPTGKAVGVPGTVAMLYEAHQAHGRLPWEELFSAAITAADEGVPYPPMMKRRVEADYSLQFFSDIREYFVYQARDKVEQEDGPPRAMLQNTELAETLRRIAEEGPPAFYEGGIAADIVENARRRWPLEGDMTLEDLQNYEPQLRDAVCGSYRAFTLCGAAPPSSGGITVLQILGMLESFEMASYAPDSPEAAHLLAEASRLAFADRQLYIGDPDFVDIPVVEMTAPGYLRQRAALISPDEALQEVFPGDPRAGIPELRQVALPPEMPSHGTSHFSIVDADGMAVSMTTSIEAPFGSRIMTNGFLLNNQLTDFSFSPELNGRPHPNAVAGGKRPRSSMAPFFVMDEAGELRYIIGSRGGSRIIGYVAQTLIGLIDWDLPMQQAVSLPNIVHRGQGLELEAGTAAAELKVRLEELGHEVEINEMQSGLHGIERTATGWRGGADPRLEGVAKGQ